MSGAWDHAALEALRLRGDPDADAVVAEIYEGQPGCYAAVNRLLRGLERNGDALRGEPSPRLRRLLEGDAALIAGFDAGALEGGARFFRSHCLGILITLQLATMPQTYTSLSGCRVLTATARLERYAYQRSLETAQMIYDIMDFGGLERPEGYGRRSAQKVRLMHAATRHLLLADGRWDLTLGLPLNQEEMVGTLGCFCLLALDGLQKMGARVDPAQAQDFYTRWRAAVALLGVPLEAMPPALAAARQQFDLIRQRQLAASPEGRRLTARWLEALRAMIPVAAIHPYLPAIIEFLLNEESAHALGLSVTPAQRRAVARVMPWLLAGDRLLPPGRRARRALDDAAWALLQWHYQRLRGARPAFAIPAPGRGGVGNAGGLV
jgi:hypothetical protein